MADQRLGDPAVPDDDGMLADFGDVDDVEAGQSDRHRSRRALWISLAAIIALGVAAVPITLHFANRAPAPLRTPAHAAGMTLDTSSNAKATAEYLRSAIAAAMNLTSSVGAVYADGTDAQADAHSVIFVGGTATGGNATLLSQILAQMNDSSDGVSGLVSQDPGANGGLMKCGLTTDTTQSDAGTADEMAVCAFADSGDVGIALFPNRTIAEAATLMRALRTSLQ